MERQDAAPPHKNLYAVDAFAWFAFTSRKFVVKKNEFSRHFLAPHGEVKNGSISRCSVTPP